MAMNQQSGGSSGTVAEQVQQSAQQVTQGAQDAVQQAGQQAKSTARDQKQSVAQSLTQVGQALHDSGNSLQQKGDNTAAQAIDMAASKVDTLAEYLQNTSIDDMIHGIQDYARREPAIFFGGAFALGFALSRFLKSSPPSANQSYTGSSGYATAPYSGSYSNRYGYGPGSNYGPSPTYGQGGTYGAGYNTGNAYGSGTDTDTTGTGGYGTDPDANPPDGEYEVTVVEEYIPGATEDSDGTAGESSY